MTPRIVRGAESERRAKVRPPNPGDPGSLFVKDQLAGVEKRAFELGYAEGERAGRKRGEELVATAARKYDQQAAEMVVSYRQLAASLERTMVELAAELARRILRRELSVRPEDLQAMAVEALDRVKFQPEIVLRVSRADYTRILEAMSGVHSDVDIREDASLEAGDFLVDTALTHLDGRIGRQVETLAEAWAGER
jgi:flagellar assembly protein FliH